MKQIITKEERNKKEKRNQLMVGLVLIVLMLLSTLGYALTGRADQQQKSASVDYKGVKFSKSSEYWTFNYNGIDYVTRYFPEETKNITFTNRLTLADYRNKPLYFVSNSGKINVELARNFDKNVLRIQSACLSSENCNENFPIKDCSIDNVIIIKQAMENETQRIYQSEKCVFIIVSDIDETMYADAFLFSVLGLR